jgi:hypothetical protein
MPWMNRWVVLLVVVALSWTPAEAQEDGRRAWQQRLEVQVPMAAPTVALEPVNPFDEPYDTPPELGNATLPERYDVRGRAEVAAHIGTEGDCSGVVPLELPFPNTISSIVPAFREARFEPAKAGSRTVASWAVVSVTLSGKIKRAEIVSQVLESVDPAIPPTPSSTVPEYDAGRLAALTAADPEALSTAASVRRMRVRMPGREVEVPVRALVHLTADGQCDRFVPLEMDPGIERWFARFLQSWRVQPATLDGQPTDAWMIYTARFRLRFSTISSDAERVLTDRRWEPVAHAPAATIRGEG